MKIPFLLIFISGINVTANIPPLSNLSDSMPHQNRGSFIEMFTDTCRTSGEVLSELGEGIEFVKIGTEITDVDGLFSFEILCDDIASVQPVRNDSFLNGVDLVDILIIRDHLLSIQTLQSPYKMIAADVNISGTLTAADIVGIERLILGDISAFSHGRSWRLISADHEFDTLLSRDIRGVSIDTLLNYVGIKVGDVNNSSKANSQSFTGGIMRSAPLIFDITDQETEIDQEVIVPVRANNLDQFAGFQLTFEYDPAELEFLRVASGSLDKSVKFGTNPFGGQLSCIAYNADGSNFESKAEDILFSLVFKAKARVKISEQIILTSIRTKKLAVDASYDSRDIELNFRPMLRQCHSVSNYNGLDKPRLSCTEEWPLDDNANPHPSFTGEPFSENCDLICTYKDTNIPICDEFSNARKILRSWTCLDLCEEDPVESTCVQEIIIGGQTEFEVELFDLAKMIPSWHSCNFEIQFTRPVVISSCSEIRRISVSIGTFSGDFFRMENGEVLIDEAVYPASNRPPLRINSGDYNVVYEIEDNCGNIHIETMLLDLTDHRPPISICENNRHVVLNSNCEAQIRSQQIDDGSYSTCAVQKMEIAKIPMGMTFPPADEEGLVYSQTLNYDYRDFQYGDTEFYVALNIENKFGKRGTPCKTRIHFKFPKRESSCMPTRERPTRRLELFFNPGLTINTKPTFELYKNYPNPFYHETTIEYSVPERGETLLRIYNGFGMLVMEQRQFNHPGTHQFFVSGDVLTSPGVYFYELVMNGNKLSGRMLKLE